MNERHADIPGIVAPPPLIFLGPLVGALLITFWLPLPFLPELLRGWLGWPLIGFGLGLGLWAFYTLRRAGTPADPYAASTAVVTAGPYRFTRNPIYLGDTLFCVGVACLFNTLWPLIVLPLTLIIVDRGVIAREERYLERKFGEAYLKYKTSVRRWL